MTLTLRWLLCLGGAGWLIIAIPACSGGVSEEPVLTDRGDVGAHTSPRRLEEAARVHTREAALESDRALAEQGDAAAQARLGAAYFRGDGVARDFQEALRWARLAAQQDNGDGQAVLGMLYRYGLGVEKDAVSAYMWLTLSTSHPWIEGARQVRDNLAASMTPEQIAEAETRVRIWRE